MEWFIIIIDIILYHL